jgi:hypothetical protein
MHHTVRQVLDPSVKERFEISEKHLTPFVTDRWCARVRACVCGVIACAHTVDVVCV